MKKYGFWGGRVARVEDGQERLCERVTANTWELTRLSKILLDNTRWIAVVTATFGTVGATTYQIHEKTGQTWLLYACYAGFSIMFAAASGFMIAAVLDRFSVMHSSR